DCELELGTLNVIIGSNGAGKSNFISFYSMMKKILEINFQLYVGKQGGPDALLHFGRKTTGMLSAELYFGDNGYIFYMEPTLDNKMMITSEKFWNSTEGFMDIGRGSFESEVDNVSIMPQKYRNIITVIKKWCAYHFHDTGENSKIKQLHPLNDNVYLRPDASNLAAYLNMLKEKHNNNYMQIVKTVRLVAPFFQDFFLRPSVANAGMIELEWFENGHDIPLKAHQFSDGTLRFICLATLLLQPPSNKPETILIDEPELGLHPYAIKLLAGLLKTAAKEKQIIVSTQSVGLLDEFDAEDIIIADKVEGKSRFSRVNPDALKEWLEEYSLGELWNKNILGGRPSK
ncbi:MAG TPA: AAA family ATPase, partial [Candidatus Wallbacteria bacterium]|nr:AAA family ATPase [Candidatus Wallbacteria bacterium]